MKTILVVCYALVSGVIFAQEEAKNTQEPPAQVQYVVVTASVQNLRDNHGGSWDIDPGDVFLFVRYMSRFERDKDSFMREFHREYTNQDISYSVLRMADSQFVLPTKLIRFGQDQTKSAAIYQKQLVQYNAALIQEAEDARREREVKAAEETQRAAEEAARNTARAVREIQRLRDDVNSRQ